LDSVHLTPDSFIVLITIDHVSDEAALRQVIHSPVHYIGMIGSRHKCETILGHLCVDGVSEEALKPVYAPIGLNLGGLTPEEIAVAILAEVIAVRRGDKVANRF
jgi:xanthine dehydrogenase accessory factor